MHSHISLFLVFHPPSRDLEHWPLLPRHYLPPRCDTTTLHVCIYPSVASAYGKVRSNKPASRTRQHMELHRGRAVLDHAATWLSNHPALQSESQCVHALSSFGRLIAHYTKTVCLSVITSAALYLFNQAHTLLREGLL